MTRPNDRGGKGKPSEFERMLEESFRTPHKKLAVGDKIKGEVLVVGKDEVYVSTGTLHDGIVPRRELLDSSGTLTFKVGDWLDLYVVKAKGSEIYLSPHPTAKNLAEDLEDVYDMMLPVEGRVLEVCKGGFRVSVKGKQAFCPISQMDLKRIENPEEYVGQRFDFRITQFSEGGRNIVVSRRKVLEEEKGQAQSSFLEEHRIGSIVQGKITRIEKFGAFVEIAPGLEGLAHVSELRWSRVEDPHEILQLGQIVSAKILKVEETEQGLKIALSLKQVESEPWDRLPPEIQVGQVVEGKVTRCVKFGAFVEVSAGVEGLIPLSEMSYTKRVLRSDEIIHEGEKVLVMVKDIQPAERRISLSLKDAGSDPWAMVSQKFPQGAIVKGRVERKENYGLFIKLDEGIIGLLPKSKAFDVPHFSYEKVKLGDEVTLRIDELKLEERRISLGVPEDPDQKEWENYSKQTTGSFGTLGEQFQKLLGSKSSTDPTVGKKKKS